MPDDEESGVLTTLAPWDEPCAECAEFEIVNPKEGYPEMVVFRCKRCGKILPT